MTEFNMADGDVVRSLARAADMDAAGRPEDAAEHRRYAELASAHGLNRDALRAALGTDDEDELRAAVKASGRALREYRTTMRSLAGRPEGKGFSVTTNDGQEPTDG